ncbi:UPF0729 protein GD16342 [Drosophila grimshawi]|uniref:GH12606 n=1 Tax=Drosophila grimshawi TaxID=7222 RepID=B4JK77_DROGR|nr:UPF0729 protein GD16342 [Drosophila grimshawi]EDV99979.1 GH12606 [Drosophila grimshawi]
MVCLPCFIIPLLLFIWHRFVQPILLRYWNPWEKKDAQGNIIKAGPDFPFECKGGVCPYVPGGKKEANDAAAAIIKDVTDNEGVAATASTTESLPQTTTAESKKQK